jgi:DNA-directed RNA polymerase specialized sigma24 family protein
MALLYFQHNLLGDIVVNGCKAVLRRNVFRTDSRAHLLNADDTSEVYQRTLRSLENKPQPRIPLLTYARWIATQEAVRYFHRLLIQERARAKRFTRFDETILNTRGPIPLDPAEILEQCDLNDKLWRLIEQLPKNEAFVIQAWMDSSHGDHRIERAAEQLGISRNAAYKLFQGGVHRLRDQLPELEP